MHPRQPTPDAHPGPRAPSVGRVRSDLLVVPACALLVVMQLYVGIPLEPAVAHELGRGGSLALTTAFSLSYAAGFLLFGALSDHVGRRRVLLVAVAGLSVTTVAVSLATSMPAVALLRGAQGFTAAGYPAVAVAYLTESLPTRLRTTGVGALSTAFLVAGIAGQVYASACAAALDWRWSFRLSACALAVAVPALARTLRASPAGTDVERLVARLRLLPALAVRRDLVLPNLGGFVLLLAFVAMYSALGPRLETQFGLTAHEVLLARLAGLPGMLLAPVAGALAARRGAGVVAAVGFATASLGLLAEGVGGGGLPGLLTATTVFVAGVAVAVPAVVLLVAERTQAARGAGASVYAFLAFVGASIGAPVAGLGLPFATLLVALAAALLAVAACLSRVGAVRSPFTQEPSCP